GRGAIIRATPTSVADSDRIPTPPIIDARFHEVHLLLDAGVEEELSGRVGELQLCVSEAQVVVFDLRGPIVVEGVFEPSADHPAPPRLRAVEGRRDAQRRAPGTR